MPNKLRSTSGRVSFFAFLDMITTVTGVLLLITLLLTLYLNNPPAIPAEQIRWMPSWPSCASASCKPRS